MQTALGIVREEGATRYVKHLTVKGFSGLYQGLPPALLRHIVYSGMRIGFYEQIRELFRGNDDLIRR